MCASFNALTVLDIMCLTHLIELNALKHALECCWNERRINMNKEQFYKSDKWEKFRRIIIDERTSDDGFIHCAICGKPILKKYDLIVHHKNELNDFNVDDVSISLNPDNVECVHFKCHNKVHERFGYNKTSVNTYVKKRVYIVYGAPCSGKSTWVRDVATANDLVVDMDSIWQMVSINDRYTKPDALRSVVFEMRDKMYDIIKYRNGKWHNAYVIVGGALKGDRERLMQRVSADDAILIDTDMKVCLDRVKQRSIDDVQKVQQCEWIVDWFDRYQPD